MCAEDEQQKFVTAAECGIIDDVRKYLNEDTVDVNGKHSSGWTVGL